MSIYKDNVEINFIFIPQGSPEEPKVIFPENLIQILEENNNNNNNNNNDEQ